MNVDVNIISNPKYVTSYINKKLSYYKTALPTKYKYCFDEISTLYLKRKIKNQSEVHKLLHKLSSRGQGLITAIDLIETKSKPNEPVIRTKE